MWVAVFAATHGRTSVRDLSDQGHRFVRPLRPMPAIQMADSQRPPTEVLEGEVMIDIARYIRKRVVSLPADSVVLRQLGRWATHLARAGEARQAEAEQPPALNG